MTDQQLLAALRREYAWRKRRYSENENGLRSHGGNCFNDENARKTLDGLEIEAERRGVDAGAIRDQVYQ